MPTLRHVLMWPFLPREARLRLRHQHIAQEASNFSGYLLATPDIAVTLRKAVDGDAPGRFARIKPNQPDNWPAPRYPMSEWSRWYAFGGMVCDGERLTVTDGRYDRGPWRRAPAGLRPGFDAAEVFQAGVRPVGSGECPDRVAVIATVGLTGRRLQRILLLDEEARELCSIPAQGFLEYHLLNFAKDAGLCYRSYSFTLGNFSTIQVSPSVLCEVLFPPSARRVKLGVTEKEVVDDWFAMPSTSRLKK